MPLHLPKSNLWYGVVILMRMGMFYSILSTNQYRLMLAPPKAEILLNPGTSYAQIPNLSLRMGGYPSLLVTLAVNQGRAGSAG